MLLQIKQFRILPSRLENMTKNTDLNAFADFDNQYAVGPTNPIILTGVKGQVYGGHRNIKWLLDYLTTSFTRS